MTRLHTILVAVTVLVAVGIAPAAANPVNDVLESDDDSSLLDKALAYASGLTDRVSMHADRLLDREDPDVEGYADDLQTTWNTNNDTLLAYVNERTTADPDEEVLKITLEDSNESETLYLVASANGDDYASAEMVRDTDRDPDGDLTLEGHAAENAADELDHFVEEYATSNEDVERDYVRKMAAKYGGAADHPFIL